MGQDHGTLNQSGSARSDRRLRPRACLRKGCAQTYQPLRWNQRYCQDPDCLRALRRWQAAQRQREHRRSPKNRQRHASAEAARREQRRKTSETICQDKNLCPPDPRRAWSRSKNNSQDLCGRPGCYEASRVSHRASSDDGLSCHSHQPRENYHDDDPKTHPCPRPRSPPTR